MSVADWREADDYAESATVRVEKVLADSRLTLIRGEAGSGKSTLVRWIAITAARARFTGDLASEWICSVPRKAAQLRRRTIAAARAVLDRSSRPDRRTYAFRLGTQAVGVRTCRTADRWRR